MSAHRFNVSALGFAVLLTASPAGAQVTPFSQRVYDAIEAGLAFVEGHQRDQEGIVGPGEGL